MSPQTPRILHAGLHEDIDRRPRGGDRTAQREGGLGGKTSRTGDKKIEKLLVVYVTCGSDDEARRLAGGLVENRLAACVNIAAVNSIYEWKGIIENDNEKLMIIKTLESKFPELERYVKDNHSYECPEIIALEAKIGSKEYIDWVKSVISVDKIED